MNLNNKVTLIDNMGSDLTVCNSARVSFNKESEWAFYDCKDEPAVYDDGSFSREVFQTCKKKLCEKDEKLIRYLASHKHWTPFAHPQITLRIKAPIPIRTQFFKHKQGFVENEQSRRYISEDPEFYEPKWRTKPTGGAKQGSDDFLCEKNPSTADLSSISYQSAIRQCIKSYHYLLDGGIAPEQARFVLPQGMYTEWYWTGSLFAYARFYNLRIDSSAQWEIREYAKKIASIIEPIYPISWKALVANENN